MSHNIPRSPLTPQPFVQRHFGEALTPNCLPPPSSSATFEAAMAGLSAEPPLSHLREEIAPLKSSGQFHAVVPYDSMALRNGSFGGVGSGIMQKGAAVKKPRRSLSTPARPLDLLKPPKTSHHHRHAHGSVASDGSGHKILTAPDPERNVKRAAAQQFAKSTFFHANFTSSHGAMMLRQTPRLVPAAPHTHVSLDQARARDRALLLMPPAMRQRYLQGEGPTPQNRPLRLLVSRSPARRSNSAEAIPTSSTAAMAASSAANISSSVGMVPPPMRLPSVAGRNVAAETRRIADDEEARPGSFALPPRAPSTAVVRIAPEEGKRLSKLSENEERQMEEDERKIEVEETLDEELVSWTDAVLELLPLAIPSAVAMALTNGLGTIPLAFVGSHFGEERLAGASVGYFLICMIGTYPINGLTFALDALVSHEYGRNPQSDVLGVLLQRGIIINLAFCVPVSLVFWNCHGILSSIYGPSLADIASEFLHYAPLFLVPMVFFTAFSKFCSNQMLPQIPMIAMAVGLASCPVAQQWLIHLGVSGAMLGMAVAAWIQLAVMVMLTFAKHETRTTFGSLRLGEVLDWDDMSAYLKLALPSALFVAAEASAFDLSVLLAATISDADGAAWSAIMNSCLPFISAAGGLSTAACAKVGASLGAGYPHDARRYAFTAVIGAAICSVINSIAIVTFFDFFLKLFGAEGEALAAGRSLMVIVPFLHIADSIQFAFQGVFSGAGQNHKGALILLSSLWAIGMPVACILTFGLGMEVRGVVLGLTIGLLVEGPCMIYTVYHLDWQRLAEEAQAEALEEDEEDEEDYDVYDEDDEEDDEDDGDEEMEEFPNTPALSAMSSSATVSSRRGRSTTPKV